MGKPDGYIKKREKATPKVPISPFWFSTFLCHDAAAGHRCAAAGYQSHIR